MWSRPTLNMKIHVIDGEAVRPAPVCVHARVRAAGAGVGHRDGQHHDLPVDPQRLAHRRPDHTRLDALVQIGMGCPTGVTITATSPRSRPRAGRRSCGADAKYAAPLGRLHAQADPDTASLRLAKCFSPCCRREFRPRCCGVVVLRWCRRLVRRGLGRPVGGMLGSRRSSDALRRAVVVVSDVRTAGR